MINFTAPLEGMAQAADRFQSVAERIARAPTAGGGDSVDLSAAVAALIESRNQFAINVKAAHAGDEMSRAVLDLLG